MTLPDVEAKLNQFVNAARADVGENLDAAAFDDKPLRHCPQRAAAVREPSGAAVADVEGGGQRSTACHAKKTGPQNDGKCSHGGSRESKLESVSEAG